MNDSSKKMENKDISYNKINIEDKKNEKNNDMEEFDDDYFEPVQIK